MAKILVVDDAPTVRTMVGKTLREDGHDITEASNGAQGLEFAQEDQFDMVVTDVNMPEMNGIELCAALRKRYTYQKVPILMLTTEGRSRVIAEGKAAGPSDWLEAQRQGRSVETRGEDNFNTLALVEAAYRAAATQQTVVPERWDR